MNNISLGSFSAQIGFNRSGYYESLSFSVPFTVINQLKDSLELINTKATHISVLPQSANQQKNVTANFVLVFFSRGCCSSYDFVT